MQANRLKWKNAPPEAVEALDEPVPCALPGCTKTFIRARQGGGRQRYCSGEHRKQALLVQPSGCRFCGKPCKDPRAKHCSKACRNATARKTASLRRGPKTCSLPGCILPTQGPRRNYCSDEHLAAKRRSYWQKKPRKIPNEQREKEARDARCRECGGPVELKRAKQALGRGWNTFCQERCRTRFWSRESHRRERARKPKRVEQKCAYAACGKMFIRQRIDARYCSTRCAARALSHRTAPLSCDMCEKRVPAQWRKRHPASKVCSSACERERRATITQIVRGKEALTRELHKDAPPARPVEEEEEP